jgi:hypothetical protein
MFSFYLGFYYDILNTHGVMPPGTEGKGRGSRYVFLFFD